MRYAGLLLALTATGLPACHRADSPPLVQVSGVSSSRLREGDLLELRGQAFPEGRRADVTLRGEVYRAGEPPIKGFELVLGGQSSSPHAVNAEVTRSVERALGGVVTPMHATFRGSVEVSFAPRVPGSPPVTGQLPEVELDFVPAEGDRALVQARRAEGERFVEFAGLLLLEGASGLVVNGVMPNAPAERAGVSKGDRLVELAGVHLLDIADFVPPPRVRSAELVVERAGVARRGRLALDVEGFRRAEARDFAAVASMIAAIVAVCLLLSSPLGRAVTFLEWRLIEALRSRRTRRLPEPGRPNAKTRRPRLSVTLAEAAALLFGSGVVMALGLGRSLVTRELDLPVVLSSLVVALGLSVLVFGVPGERGFLPRLWRFCAVLGRAVPMAAAVIALVAEVGSFGPDDLLSAQGPLPWQWLAFRGPIELGLALAWLLALLPEAALGTVARDALATTPGIRGRFVPARFIGQVELVVMSGAIALAFLGGSRVPSSFPGPLSVGLTLAAALVLLLKTWLVAALVLGLRSLTGRVDLAESGRVLWRGAVPASLILVAVALLVRRSALVVLPDAERAVSWACFGVCLLLGVALVRRVLTALRSGVADPGLNPWI